MYLARVEFLKIDYFLTSQWPLILAATHPSPTAVSKLILISASSSESGAGGASFTSFR